MLFRFWGVEVRLGIAEEVVCIRGRDGRGVLCFVA